MSGGLPLHTHARVRGVSAVEIRKVLTAAEAAEGGYPASDVLVWEDGESGPPLRSADGLEVSGLKDLRIVQPGDVVRLRPASTLVSVLFRRGAFANTLFATERCNSLCLMCSQPPRDEDDSWRVGELLRLIPLIDPWEAHLGVTGGEPTLLGEGLDLVLKAVRDWLPETRLQVLTNGRSFADPDLCRRLAAIHPEMVTWAVPLYGDTAALHDEVVQAPGAFAETLQGLYELGRAGARVEIRVVLHALTIPRLPQLAAFLYRRLPFVAHVALMGLEPMGLAKSNRERLWIDPADYVQALETAVFHLANRGVPVSIYNLPLCVLPKGLWPYARQSISGWKNVYPEECQPCALKDHCAGFFASAGPAWRSRNLKSFAIEEFVT